MGQEGTIARPARIIEAGAGPRNTNLGVPPSVQEQPQSGTVDLTRTDINVRPGVSYFDYTKPPPPELVGVADTVLINNPRGAPPNIAEVGKALQPGGRIIIQGRGRVGPASKRNTRGFNPDFQQLIDNPPPPGFRRVPELEILPSRTTQPGQILGGSFSRTDPTTGVIGEGPRPNARLVFEREPPQEGPPSTPAATPSPEQSGK